MRDRKLLNSKLVAIQEHKGKKEIEEVFRLRRLKEKEDMKRGSNKKNWEKEREIHLLLFSPPPPSHNSTHHTL